MKSCIYIGQIITYKQNDWIITQKTPTHVTIVRTNVKFKHKVVIPIRNVKPCQWRNNIKVNDPIKIFLAGAWIPARIMQKYQDEIIVQPVYTHLAIKYSTHSLDIEHYVHDIEPWRNDEWVSGKTVLHNNCIRHVRCPGILFPWEPADEVEEFNFSNLPICEFEFSLKNIPSNRTRIFKHMSLYSIMYHMMEHGQGFIRDIAVQFCSRKVAYVSQPLDYYVTRAIDLGQTQHVEELCKADPDIFAYVDWFQSMFLAKPYFNLTHHVGKKSIRLRLHFSGYAQNVDTPIRNIIRAITSPKHNPRVQGTLVESMMHMENISTNNYYERTMTCGLACNLVQGIIPKTEDKRYGGIFHTRATLPQDVVRTLVEQKPAKTLIITDKEHIDLWPYATKWHGKHKHMSNVVVTTPNTFRASAHEIPFERIICMVTPSINTIYQHMLQEHDARTIWIHAEHVTPGIAQTLHMQGWTGQEHTPSVKEDAKRTITIKRIKCQGKDCSCILENATKNVAQYLSQYLLHPALVPKYLTGKKLEEMQGTTTYIANTLNITQASILERMQDKCALCLEHMDTHSVTSCGHVFCVSCAKEVKQRKIPCPMCRHKIQSFIRIAASNTQGQIVQHNGNSYVLPEGKQEWGHKFKYIQEAVQRGDTVLSKYPNVVKKLKREFKHARIFTKKKAELMNIDNNILLVEPGIPNLKGGDKHITELIYTIKH